jgi:hypothetical protein
VHLVDDSTQASRLRQQVRTTAADIGIGQNSMQENGDFSTESGKMEKVVKCKPQGVHDQTLDELRFCHTVAGNDVLRADTRGHCSEKKKNKIQGQMGESHSTAWCSVLLVHPTIGSA